MLTGITYNCSPDSLADVDQADFVDAFENEVRAKPKYRDLKIAVTFEPALSSGLAGVESDDWEADISHEAELQDEFRHLANRAFEHCCQS